MEAEIRTRAECGVLVDGERDQSKDEGRQKRDRGGRKA